MNATLHAFATQAGAVKTLSVDWRSITSDLCHDEAEDERALRLLARIVSQLRHSLGGGGVIDWLEHPRDELDGAPPVDLLRNAEATDRLLELAVATRSSAAA